MNSKAFSLTLPETEMVIFQGLSERITAAVQEPGNDISWQAVLDLTGHRLTVSTLYQLYPALQKLSKHSLGHIYILKCILLQGPVNLPIIRHYLSVFKMYLPHDRDTAE